MTEKPFLSILTSMYNGEKYLGRYLESLKNQTCQNFEVVFWDDCSTDNSYRIVRDFIDENSGKEGRYRLYKAEKNMGGFHFCLPKALRYLNGEYLSLLTQDDFIDNDYVEKCYEKSLEKDYDIILTNTALFSGGKATQIGREYLQDFQNGKLTNRDLFDLSLTWKVSTTGGRKISLLKEAGLFDDTYYNIDEYASRKSLLMTEKIAYVDTTYYYRVDNPNALTRKVKPFTYDILTTDIMLTDDMIAEKFDTPAVVRQIEKLTSENNYYVFKFFENLDNYTADQIVKIREKLDNAYAKILSYRSTYGLDLAKLYNAEQVEKGVCYKTKGLPHVFELLTCRRREKKIRAVKLFGFQIAKWTVKKKGKTS